MPHSHELFAAAQRHIPGGVNSPVRAFKSVGGTPRFIARAEGSKVWDVDGNAYIDYVGSWGPMILGHAHPEVIRGITPDHAVLINRDNRRGSMILAGQSMFILETEPAGYIVYAANEAEKAADVTLIEARAVGAYGRLIMAGKEADISVACEAATRAIEQLTGVAGG